MKNEDFLEDCTGIFLVWAMIVHKTSNIKLIIGKLDDAKIWCPWRIQFATVCASSGSSMENFGNISKPQVPL